MTYEISLTIISLTIIYNCILNLVNKTGFQADSQSRLRSRLPGTVRSARSARFGSKMEPT